MEVQYDSDKEAIRFMKEQIGDTGKKQPKITSLEEKLKSMKVADKKYLRLFIAYSMSSVLAPTSGTRISPRVYPSLVNIKNAKKLNMCRFVIRMLCEARKLGAKNGVGRSCMLYLMSNI